MSIDKISSCKWDKCNLKIQKEKEREHLYEHVREFLPLGETTIKDEDNEEQKNSPNQKCKWQDCQRVFATDVTDEQILEHLINHFNTSFSSEDLQVVNEKAADNSGEQEDNADIDVDIEEEAEDNEQNSKPESERDTNDSMNKNVVQKIKSTNGSDNDNNLNKEDLDNKDTKNEQEIQSQNTPKTRARSQSQPQQQQQHEDLHQQQDNIVKIPVCNGNEASTGHKDKERTKKRKINKEAMNEFYLKKSKVLETKILVVLDSIKELETKARQIKEKEERIQLEIDLLMDSVVE
ncbi:hypothetical protein AX774_g7657 [Zancudomyces culisetae]|uniref:Uncharacterized protein n=1 Tax=Zancudomyces culisetae TaxID=1213189 RepID=A0A1R1PD72_ZANCU|nr:hypothetical protein AX774_g7657 [Zancudomyces culisetae]|eukprot:OMH78940.1 hypothetical protein AX774_g7657 [Zancudomyces culisetae]